MDEEQLRAAYEQEIKRVRVEHVLLENVVTLVNLGMRRTGLMPGTEDERDLAQVRLAIESVRALMPAVEQISPEQAAAVRDALSQLQMAFVQTSGGTAAGTAERPPDDSGSDKPDAPGAVSPEEPAPVKPGEAGPAQRSGRLWVPGQ